MSRSRIGRFLYLMRNIRSKELFRALRRDCRGDVLDVGGWDFYRTATRENVSFNTWTVLETEESKVSESRDAKVRFVLGDGCHMDFQDNSFDTVLNIQVLEHVMEPLAMIDEMARVLRNGGRLICLIPQTSTLHMVPNHYYNFTRFWAKESLQRAGLRVVEIKPLGGFWSSMASHLVYFFLQSIRSPGKSSRECSRNGFFYLFYPLMVLFSLFAVPVCLLFSIGDLTEEPNNHLVIAEKCGETQGGTGRM